MLSKSLITITLISLTSAQYFYPVYELPSAPAEDSAEYIELVRSPRALRPMSQPSPYPSLIPSSPLPPRVGAPGGIPLPAIQNRHGYDPMIASSSKKDPLVTAESHGHGHHHGHDYVDYGAYTGGWGAFGWYSDHPVHSYGH